MMAGEATSAPVSLPAMLISARPYCQAEMMQCCWVEMAADRCSFARGSGCVGLESWIKPWAEGSGEQAGPGMPTEKGKLQTEKGVTNGFLQETMLALNHIKALTVVMLRSGRGEHLVSMMAGE